MDHIAIAQQLAHNIPRISALLTDIGEMQARWKPTAKDWSLLEVINHLYDEEREDFRTRIDFVLHRNGEMPPNIDPEGWVSARNYNQRELATSLQNFVQERQQSVAWLQTLTVPDWKKMLKHPRFAISAGTLLHSWLAHDYLHLRQLVELHYAWVKQQAAPFSVEYAGDW